MSEPGVDVMPPDVMPPDVMPPDVMPLDEVLELELADGWLLRHADKPWSWHLTRVSGLFLAIFVPVHFAVVMIVNDVGLTTAVSMSQRTRNVSWRAAEWVLITMALGHAFLALRPLILESGRSDATKSALVIGTGVLTVLVGLFATTVLVGIG